MKKLALDSLGIPTGEETVSPAVSQALGDSAYDDGFALSGEKAAFSISGGGYSIGVEFQKGFRFAQIFAPKDKEFIAIEPMTAAANALASGRGLQVIGPGERFAASFRIEVKAPEPSS